MLTLVVLAPDFEAQLVPNPLTLRPGLTRTATVTTLATGGFAETLTYSFAGLPASIDWGGPQVVGPPYAPVAFSFLAAPGTAPGTYPGTLVASWTTFGTQQKTFPISVIVEAPQLDVVFVPATIRLCDGGPAVGSELRLDPGTSYAGTPSLAWVALPPGLEATPAHPTTPPLPPARSIPVRVRAQGTGPGFRTLTLRAHDAVAGVDVTAHLGAETVVGDFVPQALPSSVALTAGGAARSLVASLAAGECFGDATVTVTPLGLPHGVRFEPAVASLAGPGWAPATFSAHANASARAGTYPVTLRFQGSGGTLHDLPVQVTVASAAEVALELAPSAVTVAAGDSTRVDVRATGVGLSGALHVLSPALPFLTFTPAAFDLRLGETRTVELRARRDAPPARPSAASPRRRSSSRRRAAPSCRSPSPREGASSSRSPRPPRR